jgi:hypothetical protein
VLSDGSTYSCVTSSIQYTDCIDADDCPKKKNEAIEQLSLEIQCANNLDENWESAERSSRT